LIPHFSCAAYLLSAACRHTLKLPALFRVFSLVILAAFCPPVLAVSDELSISFQSRLAACSDDGASWSRYSRLYALRLAFAFTSD